MPGDGSVEREVRCGWNPGVAFFSGAGWGRRDTAPPRGTVIVAGRRVLDMLRFGLLDGGFGRRRHRDRDRDAGDGGRNPAPLCRGARELSAALRDAGKNRGRSPFSACAQERGCSTPDLERLLAELPPLHRARQLRKGSRPIQQPHGKSVTVLDRRLGGFGAVYKVRDHEMVEFTH